MSDLIQRSFTAGEIAPSLRSRADMSNYITGLALCQNFIPRVQGGVYSRPGTRFIGEIGDSSKRARLIPFSFSTEQTYILVFEHLTMRVVANGGFVLAGVGSAIYELTTTYTEAELSRLSFTQSADVMTIVHPDHDPADLSRTAHDNWTLTTVDYSSTVTAPTFAGATTVATITGITQANPAVVTAVAHGFSTGNTVDIAGVVGMTEVNGRSFKVTVLTSDTFELQGEDSTTHTAYVSDGTATRQDNAVTVGSGFGTYDKTYDYVVTTVDEAGIESIASAVVSLESKSLSDTAGIRLTWATVTGADYYRVYKDTLNSGVFGWIGDSKNLTFDDYNIAPLVADAPPEDRTPFDGVGNKPSEVAYYQQRQILANTLNEPQAVFTTQTANYHSLRTSNPARDDDAVTFTIAGKQVNEIRHIVTLDGMLLLTPGGVWRVTEGQNEVLTPSTAGVRIQSYHGVSWVPPANIGDTIIYLQEKGSRIRDVRYEFASDNYTGNDLSIMAEHLFEGYTIEEMVYSEEPYGVLWCVRDDGVLLGLTYQREHKIWAWHQHVTDGFVESISSITEDDRDAVHMCIRRTINGSTKRYVERLEIRDVSAAEDAFCVDSGLTYNGAAVTSVSGLDHLEGKTVVVLADGIVPDDEFIVSGGSITLTRAAAKIHIGLPYTCAMETLDIDVAGIADSMKAKNVSVSEVSVAVESSRGGWVGAKHEQVIDPTLMQEIKPLYESDGYDPAALKTFTQSVYVQPVWGKSGGIRIEQRVPLPLAILAVIPDVSIGG